MQRRHLRREYVSFRHIGNQNPTKAGIPPSLLRFLRALQKASTHLFPTLSPPLSPLLQFVFNFLFVSYIKYCFVPFTAAPLICGLAFTYQVSAVCFAWLCGGDWLNCPSYFEFHYDFYFIIVRLQRGSAFYHFLSTDRRPILQP